MGDVDILGRIGPDGARLLLHYATGSALFATGAIPGGD
jgi:hypothetical protein